MTTFEDLKSIFKNHGELFAYLRNKNRGGVNNAKGNCFENFFAVYKIAELYNSGCVGSETLFSAQAFCFVDDLVVEQRLKNTISHYQIKDVQNLDWLSGDHPMGLDFEMQHKLYENKGGGSDLTVVVSNREVHDHLLNNMPNNISAFSKVIHFGTADSISNLIRTNVIFKNELIKISAINNPATDKLEAIGTIILGAWDACGKSLESLENLLQRCYTVNPHYIKGNENQISKDLKAVFLSIDGFHYEVQNGFINWVYRNTDAGVCSLAIGTPKYIQWENDVLVAMPDTFERLEPYLFI